MDKKDYRELDRPIKSARISTPKKTAFKALKEYCEYYLEPDEYMVVPETSSYCATIYFTGCRFITYQVFTYDGSFYGVGNCEIEDMNDHIEEAKKERAGCECRQYRTTDNQWHLWTE